MCLSEMAFLASFGADIRADFLGEKITSYCQLGHRLQKLEFLSHLDSSAAPPFIAELFDQARNLAPRSLNALQVDGRPRPHFSPQAVGGAAAATPAGC